MVTTRCQIWEREAERLLGATQDVRDMGVGRALDIPPTESQLHAPYPLALTGLAWTPCGHFPRTHQLSDLHFNRSAFLPFPTEIRSIGEDRRAVGIWSSEKGAGHSFKMM